jgi:hypothetical protein
VTTKAAADVVAILVEVLQPLVGKQAKVDLSSVQIAQILANTVPGFKASAKNTAQLRRLITGLITAVLASLQKRESLWSAKTSSGLSVEVHAVCNIVTSVQHHSHSAQLVIRHRQAAIAIIVFCQVKPT